MLPIIVIFAIVLGGIYGDVFTPTEASAVGAAGVTIVTAAMGRLTWPVLRDALHQTGVISSMIFAIITGGVMFARFMVHTGITSGIVAFIGRASADPVIVLIFIAIMYLVLGCILDTFGMLILTLPFVIPVIVALGVDKVWFGIFITMMIELALITPPVGLNVFVLRRVAISVPVGEIFRGAAPFVVLIALNVAVLFLWPGLALWLPSQMN
ncbi:TRAP transporter large permease subunit [Hoeflea sp. WL0058]|uniref:TRAP transporter large permease subunit n=1 Tax=Flavimaribacter sediminis TaxID=2865987 RepID=A0AAE2ZPZ0_9HYPH|nr:TRAP transporter large permease subunit [Flavimaribacter sediminis]MBW8638740.1 TRAP transporter large permease subunit [Flavimaribacter sediminis]